MEELKPFGPDHTIVPEPMPTELNCKVLPEQRGPLLKAVGVPGAALTVTEVVATVEVQVPTMA